MAKKPPDAREVAPAAQDADLSDASIRPRALSEFVGQPKLVANLKVFISAARERKEALDHVLLAEIGRAHV